MRSSKPMFLVLLFIAAAAASISAQSSLEVGTGGYLTDVTRVYADGRNGFTANGNQTDKYAPNVQPYVSYTLTQKRNSFSLKYGLYAEDWIGLYQGATAPYEFQMAGKVEPSVELLAGGLDAKVSFPLVFFSPQDASGINELKYAYKPYSYGYFNNSPTPDYTQSFWVTNYAKLTYKFAFDNTMALTVGAEADTGFTPVLTLFDVKPQLSFVYGPAQLDAKAAFYFNDNYSNGGANGSDDLYLYIEPKLSFDFGGIGVTGLRAFVSSRVSTYTTATKYTSAAPWHDTWIAPGVSYKIGGLYLEGDFKCNKIDSNAASDANDKNVAPFFEPQLKVSYTFAF
jgi:hypothetical protein